MRKRHSRILVAVILVGLMAASTAVYAATRGAARGGVPLSVGPQGSAKPQHFNCATKKGNEADGLDTGLSTTSTTFVDVPGMVISFNARNPGCALVSFSAWAFAPGGSDELLMVRALGNGVECAPGEYQFAGDDNTWAVSHASNFTCPVAAGANTIRAQWRSFFGGTVFMHRRALLVWHG